MSWKWDILNEYARHLFENHSNDENFDVNDEHRFQKDYINHWKGKDGDEIIIKCDHINCNYVRRYHVMFTVTPIGEEEE